MSLPGWLENVLPADAASTWERIAPAVPKAAYLVGGTAITVHLQHRVSRDLDFFFHKNGIDLDQLASRLSELGPFAITWRAPGKLNGVFSETKLQFLHADEGLPQRLLERPKTVEGLQIAGISDLLATKLKVIGDRGEARDYFDLMRIEERSCRRVEEGLGLFLARYNIPNERATSAIDPIVRALGYFDDVEEDKALPVSLKLIERYWQRRQPEVIASISRFGL
jgi:hypothetical protein